MTEVARSELKKAIEAQHGGTATFAQAVPLTIAGTHSSVPAWKGLVQVFDLMYSPSGAPRVYSWSYGLPDGKRRFFALLHAGQIQSPRDAVKAAIAAEYQSRR